MNHSDTMRILIGDKLKFPSSHQDRAPGPSHGPRTGHLNGTIPEGLDFRRQKNVDASTVTEKTSQKTIVLSVIVAIVAIVTMDGLALEQKSVHRVYTPTNTTDGGAHCTGTSWSQGAKKGTEFTHVHPIPRSFPNHLGNWCPQLCLLALVSPHE